MQIVNETLLCKHYLENNQRDCGQITWNLHLSDAWWILRGNEHIYERETSSVHKTV